MNDKPNKITTVLKVVVTGEFYDDDATEETLRYAVEQDLEDAGFDVDVALLKARQWVSVKDRLPEATEPDVNGNVAFSALVLVFIEYENGFTYTMVDKCNVIHKAWLSEIPGEGCHVTHWMPLPEPPKEGDGE